MWRENLSFSSSKQDDALLLNCAEESVSSSSSESSNVMSGGLGFGGPFTPTQIMELQQQISIFRCIESSVPIPPELLISFAKRPIPKRSSPFSYGLRRHKTFGVGLFQIGFMSYPDPEPGRCRRTDGKKWRCSREAIPNHKYCERHINRGRNRSRKFVEGHTSRASKLVPSASPVSGAGLPSSFPVTKKSMENLQVAILDSSPAQLNRTIPILTEQTSYSTLSSVPPLPDFMLSSNDSLLNLPTNSLLQNTSFFPSVDSLGQGPYNMIDELSCSSSPLPENLILSPPNFTDEFAAFDTTFDTCLGTEQSLNIMSGASMNGPLGEVLANSNNIEYVNCSLSSNNVRTEEWDLSPEFCSSVTNVQPNTCVDFPSTSASGSCNKGGEEFCSSSNVSSPTFPPL